MSAIVIDESTEFGERTARHLREEIVVWMTTVSPSGSPLPRPVWFVWDGADSVWLHSMEGARIRNIEANPRVSLNFAGDGRGGNIVVLSGRAGIDPSLGSAETSPEYLAKYEQQIARIGLTPATFAAKYNVPVRVRLSGLRGA